MQNEETLVGLGGLDVAVLTLGGLDDAKMDLERRFILGTEQDTDLILLPQGADLLGLPQIEGKVGKILGALDVILVGVGPVQFHFLAVVRHGKRRGLAGCFPGVIAAGDKVAVVVVALKEAIQVVIHIGLGAGRILDCIQRGFGLFDRLGLFRIGCAEILGGLNGLLIGGLQLGLAGLVGITEGIRHDFQQVGADEVLNFLRLGVHDAVKAEIEVRLVELKQLGKLLQKAAAKLFGRWHGYLLIP